MKTLIADQRTFEIHRELAEINRRMKADKKRFKELADEIKLYMGEIYDEILDDDTNELLITWKESDSNLFDTKTFKEFHPKLYKKFLDSGTKRTFLVK